MNQLKQALTHHRTGRLEEAEAAYRQILACERENPDALHVPGMLTAQAGNCKTGYIRS